LQWQSAATGGEIEPITRKIAKLSGAEVGAAGEAYDSFREEPGPGD
jgi:hypothetical protein